MSPKNTQLSKNLLPFVTLTARNQSRLGICNMRKGSNPQDPKMGHTQDPTESETVNIKITRLQINPTMNCQLSSRGPFAIHGNPPPIGITLECAIIAHDQQCTIFIESDPSQ